MHEPGGTWQQDHTPLSHLVRDLVWTQDTVYNTRTSEQSQDSSWKDVNAY